MSRRLLVMGGHEFDRLDGNESICDHIIGLSGGEQPKVCLLPTASGDPEDQIHRFRRSFGGRGCEVSDISLFRLGTNPIDVGAHLLEQDVIYIGGGSLLNLVAIWQAHGIADMIEICLDRGVLICGQSAGAMAWFEYGITTSFGLPASAPGLGMIPGSLCVHYHRDPGRRQSFINEIGEGTIPGGYGCDDQTGLLFEDGELSAAFSAREGAGIWRVEPGDAGTATETGVEAELLIRSKTESAGSSAVDDFRQLSQWRSGRS